MPIAPEAIGRDAARVEALGVASVHVHPRAEDGSESLHATHVAAAVAAVRAASPTLACGVTTGAWIEPDIERRLALIAAWTELPDFASVNIGEAGADAVIDLLCARGIEVEAGVWNEQDARAFLARGLDSACMRILVEVDAEDDAGAAVARASSIDLILDDGLAECPRLHHGGGVATWSVIESALDRGHDVRIGLEDTLVLADGSAAAGNAVLVETCAGLARAAGRLVRQP